MKAESVIFGICGVFFGLLVGWMLGDQYAAGRPVPVPAAAQAAAAPAGSAPPAPLNEARVQELRAATVQNPQDAKSRAQLGDLYFDAERYDEAIRWYEEAMKLNSQEVNVITDLGVSYYYTNQADRAVERFSQSLAIDPKHVKTLLNLGIVLAFGKQDLEGAQKAWEQVVAIAPESPEGRAAKQALESMKAAHPNPVQNAK